MTFGTSKVFRSGLGYAINIAKHCCDEQRIEPGCIVQYEMRKLDIPPKEPNHFIDEHKKEEIKEPVLTPV